MEKLHKLSWTFTSFEMSFFMKLFYLLALFNYVRKLTPPILLPFLHCSFIVPANFDLAPLSSTLVCPLNLQVLHHILPSIVCDSMLPRRRSSRTASCVTELPWGRDFPVQGTGADQPRLLGHGLPRTRKAPCAR